jgi:predicted transcriptional regulator
MAKRPSAPPPSKRLHPLAIRFDDDLLEELREMARAETRPVANLAVHLIKEALEARRLKREG